jgi:hypothetical protein
MRPRHASRATPLQGRARPACSQACSVAPGCNARPWERAVRAPGCAQRIASRFGCLASRERTHRKVSCPAATLPACLPPARKDSAPGAMAPTPLRREQRQCKELLRRVGGTSAAQAAADAAARARLALRGARQRAAAAQCGGERGGRPPGVACRPVTALGPSFGATRVRRTHRGLRRRRPHQHAKRVRSGERNSGAVGRRTSETRKGRASQTRPFRLRASRASSLSRCPRGQGPAQPAAGAGRGAARRACRRAQCRSSWPSATCTSRTARPTCLPSSRRGALRGAGGP